MVSFYNNSNKKRIRVHLFTCWEKVRLYTPTKQSEQRLHIIIERLGSELMLTLILFLMQALAYVVPETLRCGLEVDVLTFLKEKLFRWWLVCMVANYDGRHESGAVDFVLSCLAFRVTTLLTQSMEVFDSVLCDFTGFIEINLPWHSSTAKTRERESVQTQTYDRGMSRSVHPISWTPQLQFNSAEAMVQFHHGTSASHITRMKLKW